MKAKKNNKGFSLVELIVVVLIMGIIAVALAPQVMKWVGTSRENTDANNAATLKQAISTAVADFLGTNTDATQKLTDITFTINGSAPASGTITPANFEAKVTEVVNGSWPKSVNWTGFEVTVTKEGSVKVVYDASGNFK